MDEIFFTAHDSQGRVSILVRCPRKECLDLHHFTNVDEKEIAKIIVDAMNASEYAREVSSYLSAEA